jgi:hypothetical protein
MTAIIIDLEREIDRRRLSPLVLKLIHRIQATSDAEWERSIWTQGTRKEALQYLDRRLSNA